MTHSYQSYNNLVNSSDAIAKRKNHFDKIAKMKLTGTYCDNEDPDLSFLNFRTSCKHCPNYKECKEESEKRSHETLKMYRNKKVKKSNLKRG